MMSNMLLCKTAFAGIGMVDRLRRDVMGTHPANLALRFLLELGALAGLAYWGWTTHDGVWRFVWAVGLVLVAAILWGTFNVPDDPSRSGQAPVPVPGLVRLILELAIFAAASWAIITSGRASLGFGFAAIVLVHYLLSYDRILWLIRQ
jgi:hypothetical protein